MGFKVDSSFLRFLTMGALASQRVIEIMTAAGLRPIELERYSSSNKIWTTKAKRLRLPDLLCLQTGLRVEVRGKGSLAIRMSDAPDNPARRWFTRPDDMVAFVHCSDTGGRLTPAPNAELFWVEHLLNSEAASCLGRPKSASEGSERDRLWRSIVPKRDGEVLQVNSEQITVRVDTGRRKTYRLRGLNAYVSVGQHFSAASEFIAGLPARKASFQEAVGRIWNPRDHVAGDAVDRYVAAKSLGAIGALADGPILRALIADTDARVALEAAGSLAKLGERDGFTLLVDSVRKPTVPYLRMEAVFLLSELRNCVLHRDAEDALWDIARDADLVGDEARQAAIWGLGRAGLCAYDRLLDFLDAANEDERIHAVVAFGPQLSSDVTQALIGILTADASLVKKAAACHVLSKLTDYEFAVRELISAARSTGSGAVWAKAALGSLPPEALGGLADDQLAVQLAPIQLLSSTINWTKVETAQDAINFVSKQTVFPH